MEYAPKDLEKLLNENIVLLLQLWFFCKDITFF